MSLLHLTPTLSPAAAADLVLTRFGIGGDAVPLPGERDQNFRIDAHDGRCLVLKISNGAEDVSFLEAQHLAMATAGDLCATPIPASSGHTIEVVDIDGRLHLVRLLTWLEGEPMGVVAHRTPALLESLGRAVARIDRGLEGIDHPSLHRDFAWDLAMAPGVLSDASVGLDDAARAFVAHALSLHAAYVRPLAARLRQQAIHNDANDYNVLVGGGDGPGPIAPGMVAGAETTPGVMSRRQRVVGVLDFGDMIWSARVNDVAVASAYALLGHDDAVEAIATVVGGYHRVLPLDDDELAAVFALVLLRLALSLHHAARQTALRPDDPYLAISQGPVARGDPCPRGHASAICALRAATRVRTRSGAAGAGHHRMVARASVPSSRTCSAATSRLPARPFPSISVPAAPS